jgi:hypothetical protein
VVACALENCYPGNCNMVHQPFTIFSVHPVEGKTTL